MKRFLTAAALALFALIVVPERADACTRVVYSGETTPGENTGENENIPVNTLRIVGRSLDWRTPIPTNLYVYPRGMRKVSSNRPGAKSWTSRYGAVYAVSYDGGITEGMNEKGLVINGLFCKGTVYTNESNSDRPPMSMAVFVAWMLDNCATTQEVVDLLSPQDFAISGQTFDGGTVSALHWGVTDAEGNSAIVEFDNGVINIYQGTDLDVLTNDPPYPQMQAINAYWDKIGGTHMLPGTVTSPDRFVRASFFNRNVVHTNDAATALPILRSIMVNASVPYLYTVDGEPNVSSTQWRTYANLRDKQYWFDTVTADGIYYVDLKECNLTPGAPVTKIVTADMQGECGDVTNLLKPVAPFTPMY